MGGEREREREVQMLPFDRATDLAAAFQHSTFKLELLLLGLHGAVLQVTMIDTPKLVSLTTLQLLFAFEI